MENVMITPRTPPWGVKLHYNVFYISWNKKYCFNENECDKLYPSGTAPARIYGTPKMINFFSSDAFSKFCPNNSSIGFFN